MPEQERCLSIGLRTLSVPVAVDKESFVAYISHTFPETNFLLC